MKTLRWLTLLIWVCLLSLTQSAYSDSGNSADTKAGSMRHWVTADGNVQELAFQKYAKGKILLHDKDQNRVILEVKNLSIVDRLYLLDIKAVDEKDLLAGYTAGIEAKLRVPTRAIERKPHIEFSVGDDTIRFEVLETPHFQIWSEKGVKAKEIATLLEQIWFYHAYRTPFFRGENFLLKEVIILTNSEEMVKKLIAWNIESNPQFGEEYKTELNTTWEAPERRMLLPKEYIEKNNLYRSSYTLRLDKHDYLDEGQAFFAVHYTRELFMKHQNVSIFNSDGDSSSYFWFALGLDAEMTFYETIETGIHFDGSGDASWGDARQWARAMGKEIKKGNYQVKLDVFFEKDFISIDREHFGPMLTSVGMFLRSNMEREIGTARFIQLTETKGELPSVQEFVECYGYQEISAMEKDIEAYILAGRLE